MRWGPHVLPGVPSLLGLGLSSSGPFHRGFDIGNHFCEWTYDYTHHSWPFFKAIPENYPSREQQVELGGHQLHPRAME